MCAKGGPCLLNPLPLCPGHRFPPAARLTARLLPFSQAPAVGPGEHLGPGVQQLLEGKQQALAILQETVKVQCLGCRSMSAPLPWEGEGLVVASTGKHCLPFSAAQIQRWGHGVGWDTQSL